MKIYNFTTHELFNIINFEKPTLFRNFKNEFELITSRYCYFFPQKCGCYHGEYKVWTMYYYLFWRLKIHHTRRNEKSN